MICKSEVIPMINAYPITAIKSYKTHKDYYNVSAVRGVSGSRSNTTRQPLDLPYDRSAYKQLVQSAAEGLAGLVQSASTVKQSAQSLVYSRAAFMQDRDSSFTEGAEGENTAIRDFIDAYNTFQDNLRETPEYLNRSLLKGLEQAAKPYSLTDLGISEQADGTLQLQEGQLQKQAAERNNPIQTSLGNIKNLAASLSTSLGQLTQLPSEALFQLANSPLKPYRQYRSKLQSYLPVPMSGLLLDRRL
ncbi:hypothetical protein [Paenibacillus sp. SI8]|uniref:hypothetical protein n=1 Tax=unclassified Paenibacillus TaxID=185978 RepID=UPI003464F9BC